jgi:hypothetical protein
VTTTKAVTPNLADHHPPAISHSERRDVVNQGAAAVTPPPHVPRPMTPFQTRHRRPVNPLCEGMLQQRRSVPTLVIRKRLGGWIQDHGVPEAFQLGDEPSGVGFVIASAVPIGSQVVIGLVAFEHPIR